MKKIILFSLIYLIPIQCYAQNTWPAPDVQSNIKSKWEFTLRDSLSHNNGYHSNYFNHIPYIMNVNNDVLITNVIDATYDFDGGFISKIDIPTGAHQWTFINNRRNNKYQESMRNFYFDDQDNIHITGLRALRSIDTTYPFWALGQNLLCNPFERVLDHKTGTLLKYNTGNDTADFRFKHQPPLGFSTTYKLEGDKAIFFNRTYPKTKSRLEYYKVNANYDIIDTLAYDSLTLSSDVITDYFFNIWTTVYQLNSKQFLATISQLGRDETQYPAFVELVWFTIDSNYKVSIDRRKNISSYYKFPKYQDGQNTVTRLGNIFIHDSYKLNESPYSWLAWLDKNGNEKAYLKEIKLNDFVYNGFREFIPETDTSFILIANSSSTTNSNAVDLIRVGTHGAIQLLSTLSFESEFQKGQMIYNAKNKKLLVNGVLCRNNCKDRWVKHLAYDIKDLGYTTAVDEPTLASISTIKLSPNPSDHYIDLHYNNITAASINILNVLGEVVLSQSITNTNYQRINTANLVVGSYILQLTDDKNKIHTEQFVIAR